MALRLESAAARIGSNVAGVSRYARLEVTSRAFPSGAEFRGSALNLSKGLQCQNNLLKRRGGGIRCLGSNTTPLANGPPTLSDYILDRVSSFLITQGKTLMPKTMSGDDPLNWLPPKLHDQIHRSEAFAVSLVREGLVFGTLGLMYCQVDAFCQGLHKYSAKPL